MRKSCVHFTKVRIREVALVDSGLGKESRTNSDSIEMEIGRLNGHNETGCWCFSRWPINFISCAPVLVPTVSVDSQTTGVKTLRYAGGLPSSNRCIVSPGPMACRYGGRLGMQCAGFLQEISCEADGKNFVNLNWSQLSCPPCLAVDRDEERRYLVMIYFSTAVNSIRVSRGQVSPGNPHVESFQVVFRTLLVLRWE